MGESTLELLQKYPAYSELIWGRITSLLEVRGSVLEVGCGVGTITGMILRSPGVKSLDAIDMESSYVERVARGFQDPRLRVICSTAEKFDPPPGSYDRVVSINVLEHLEDDQAILEGWSRALRPGGQCAILVPAHPSLYSSLDTALSHFRRYTRQRFVQLAAGAGLDVRRLVHFNPLGTLGWWLNGKVLRRQTLPAGQVALYARLGIVLSRWLDRINPFPVGLSIIACLEKPGAPES